MSVLVAVTDDIASCRALRRVVFIEEQGVSETDEVDDLDPVSIHLLAVKDGVAVGSARIVPVDDTAKIGRVCVVKDERGDGLGAELIRSALLEAKERGFARAKLGSQVHAIGFYEKLGFTVYGPVYDDAGIDHRDMVFEL
jgi:ElaA protein